MCRSGAQEPSQHTAVSNLIPTKFRQVPKVDEVPATASVRREGFNRMQEPLYPRRIHRLIGGAGIFIFAELGLMPAIPAPSTSVALFMAGPLREVSSLAAFFAFIIRNPRLKV